MTAFDEATAVSRRSEGLYDARADARFALVAPGGTGTAPPAVNGGVLMATVLRAALDSSQLPHPIAMSANFLRVPVLGPAQVEVSWLKRGKTAAVARATLLQDGLAILDTTITTGTLPTGPVPDGTHEAGAASDSLDWTGRRPDFPDIADCADLGKWPGAVAADGTAGYPGQVQVLMDPACTGWRGGQPSGLAEMRGYLQLREHRDPDALMLALAVDALPPVVFGLGATGWAPTVELTWHMRAVPAAGPLQVSCRSRHVSGGWFDEEAEVWDSAGRLVAQSRQMARVGRGRLRDLANGAAAASATATN